MYIYMRVYMYICVCKNKCLFFYIFRSFSKLPEETEVLKCLLGCYSDREKDENMYI